MKKIYNLHMFFSKGLFTLIKSLSRNEKKYFYLFSDLTSNENKIYYEIFKEIDAQDYLDVESIKQKFGHKYGHNLGMLKEKLYEQILNSLHNYYREDRADNKIIKWTQDAKLLIQKGLYKLAMKKIDKGLRLSQELDRYLLANHLVNLKKTVYMHRQYEGIKDSDIDALFKVEKLVTDRVNQISEANNFQFLYYYHIARNNTKQALDIVNRIQVKLKSAHLITAEKAIYYNILSNYYESKENLKKAIQVTNLHITLLTSHSVYQSEYFGNYILQQFNLISLLILQDNIPLAESRLKIIKEENQSNKRYKHLIMSLYYSNVFQIIAIKYSLSDYDSCLNEMNVEYKKMKLEVSPNLIRHSIYCRAVLLIQNKEYKACVQYLQLNMAYSYSSSRFFFNFWLILIICYIQLDDAESLLQILNTYKSHIKLAEPGYLEDQWIQKIYEAKDKKLEEIKKIRPQFNSKKSDKDLYFPLRLKGILAPSIHPSEHASMRVPTVVS